MELDYLNIVKTFAEEMHHFIQHEKYKVKNKVIITTYNHIANDYK